MDNTVAHISQLDTAYQKLSGFAFNPRVVTGRESDWHRLESQSQPSERTGFRHIIQ